MGGCNRVRMSENEKAILFMCLFPIFWPFIPVVLVCMACEGAAKRFREWRWRRQDTEADKAAREAARLAGLRDI